MEVFFFVILLIFFPCYLCNPSDCWNENKLNQANYQSDNEQDVNLSKFNMMVKCLMQERGSPFPDQSSGGEMDYSQFKNVGKPGQFPVDWNDAQKPRGNKPKNHNFPQKQPEWGQKNQMNREHRWPNREKERQPWPNRDKDRQPWPNREKDSQPWPGVRPEDLDQPRINHGLNNENLYNPMNKIQGNKFDNPVWGQPSFDTNDYNNNNKKQKPKKKNFNKQNNLHNNIKKIENNNPSISINEKQIPSLVDPSIRYDEPNQPPGDNYISSTFEYENPTTLTLHRKYGYIVMALSVLVLAVLMVSTIFCCNSSNSTMSHAGVTGIAHMDNYSLYSYKQGMILPTTMDTLQSGTIRSSMKTDTLKSTATQYHRASPQYRVSDLDPEYHRRYKEENHY